MCLADGVMFESEAMRRPENKAASKFRKAMRSLLVSVLAAATVVPAAAIACTRVVYFGYEGTVITARSMDWKLDVGTNLWVFPRGMKRSGVAGPNSITWTSK